MNVLPVLAPFIFGGLILAGFKAVDAYSKWKYRRAVEKRNAKLYRYGLMPFRGVKERVYDDQH